MKFFSFLLFSFLLCFSHILSAQTRPSSKSNNEKPPRPAPLTLSQIIGNGAFLMLSDNSVWAIAPADTILSGAWISAAEITIQQSQDPLYPFLLYNNITEDSVRAKKSSLDEIHQRVHSMEMQKQETILEQQKIQKKAEELKEAPSQ